MPIFLPLNMGDFDQKNMAEVTYLCVEAEVLRNWQLPIPISWTTCS